MGKLTDRSKCISCSNELKGTYCHACGQKQIKAEDKKFKYLLAEFFTSVFYADGKFFKTMKTLFLKPGELSKMYIQGNRKKYLGPLQLFFFANLLYFLFPVFSSFNTTLYTQMNSLPYSKMVAKVVTEHVESDGLNYADFEELYERKSTANAKLLLIVLVLWQAAILKLLFFRNRQYYFSDYFATSAYFNSFYIITLLVVFPGIILLMGMLIGQKIYTLLNDNVFSIILMVIIVFYLSKLFRKTFQTKIWESVLKSGVFALFLIPSFIIYRFILFWVTFLSVT